jgi:uncharacterized protein YigA (DUF484 family)
MGVATSWRTGFPDDSESYRSWARAKKRQEQEEADRLQSLERKNKELFDMYHQWQKQLDEIQ